MLLSGVIISFILVKATDLLIGLSIILENDISDHHDIDLSGNIKPSVYMYIIFTCTCVADSRGEQNSRNNSWLQLNNLFNNKGSCLSHTTDKA